MKTEPLNVISLGAGVQSSTMALMAAHGEITPMPDCAVFADTQAEPQAVYVWLDWLERQLPFPVHRVTGGNLFDAIGKERPRGKYRKVDIPAFVKADGKVGLLNRSCTADYKIKPIRRKVREMLGLYRRRSPQNTRAIQWIGISLDEALRMKDSDEPWLEHRFPLIERKLTRRDCLDWMKRKGYPKPPKSACVFCPFHDAEQWRGLDGADFQRAVEVDDRLRVFDPASYRNKGLLYLHRSCKPLAERPFDKPVDAAQPSLFINECEGMCGV